MAFYRKVIQIRAEDSPNVRRALEEIKRGLKPSGMVIVPGVLTWEEYKARRATWDEVRQCIGLDAAFYKGKQLLLYPPNWLNHSEMLARNLHGKRRQAEAIGVDPAQGGDDTSMCAVDRLGLIEQVSKKTPNTDIIPGEILAFMRRWSVPADKVLIDLGGGGKQAADRLRAQGHTVNTLAFNETLALPPRHGPVLTDERIEAREERLSYANMRAKLFGDLHLLMDPDGEEGGFAIPEEYRELRRQLAPIPKLYDGEGRLFLPPKDKRNKDSKEKTLTELIGRSPDDADALVLAVHAMLHEDTIITAGIL